MEKKQNISILPLLLMWILLLVVSSCGKDGGADPSSEDSTNEDANTGAYGSMTDLDGNTYQTLTIGSQTWMVENLRVTHYNDGTAIPNVTDADEWVDLTTGAYCWYDNDESTYKEEYGALYNWYTVNTGKLAPSGWHVPTDEEWTELEHYLAENGYAYDGTTYDGTETDNEARKKLTKCLASTSGWEDSDNEGAIGNNQSANNSTGFNAPPSGMRINSSGESYSAGISCCWWSSTKYESSRAYNRNMYYYTPIVGRYHDYKTFGFSVRCVKD